MTRRATSYDVARLAGVSQSAVSRCFTPGASIADATRLRVTEAARRLGYVPNRLAQGLSKKQSSLVALLLPSFVNLYFPELLADLTSALEKEGLRPLLFVRDDLTNGDRLVSEAVGHGVDGVISALDLNRSMLEPALNAGLPVVMLNRDGRKSSVSSVMSDHSSGAASVADLLVRAGCSRIAMIGGPEGSPTGRWRGEAFKARLSELRLQLAGSAAGDYTYGSGKKALAALLSAEPSIDGLFCANDGMAMGALDLARHERGLIIPDNIKIVGFDDLSASSWSGYGLTTVRQRVDILSGIVAKRMAERVRDPHLEACHDVVDCELIIRSTCN